MNKTKIEWVRNPDGSKGYAWNPVTGCLNDCAYCYAKKIANRFGEKFHKSNSKIHELVEYDGTRIDLKTDFSGDYSLGKLPVGWESPYPFSFEPTLHYYRLGLPINIRKPNRVFVCSMADLFGPWVPSKWIKEVIRTVKVAHWHTFMFLTKFPARYKDFEFPKNCWLGTTVTGIENVKALNKEMKIFFKNNNKNVKFISFEPLLGLTKNYNLYIRDANWIIIGGLTPKNKHKDWWVRNILIQASNIPVFMKDNLKCPYKKIREFP